MSEHSGNMWYKCDFHLHTMSSKCYKNQEDTPKMWVDRCVEQGLKAIAVTDHNDYRGISDIMSEGANSGLTVFPGVEICCDTSKIHMLILFDVSEDADTVRDFLSRCDIDKSKVGDPDGTNMDVFSVCKIAKSRGALVVAAHIDEFNSINSMNPANLDLILDRKYIDAVQVTNVPVWEQYNLDKDAATMQNILRDKYGADATEAEIDRWRKCYERAKNAGIPMLSFSDNPASEDESKHGLWGIGSKYTWIQMDEDVDLESIRQSLLSADSRVKMMYDCVEEPAIEPDFWIKSLDIRNTLISNPQGLHLDFHPQLNCIIGGCGSGKSALIQVLSGAYGKLTSSVLPESYQRQCKFYKQYEESDDSGIFKDASEIEIRFKCYGTDYRMVVSDINSQVNQTYTIFRIDPNTGEEEQEDFSRTSIKSLLGAKVFIQKEIYELANNPVGILEMIDSSIPDMPTLKEKKRLLEGGLITTAMDIHSLENISEDYGKIEIENVWLSSGNAYVDSSVIDARIEELIKRRKSAQEEIEKSRKRLEDIKRERQILVEAYERNLTDIRNARMSVINMTLWNDENYKMELLPFADKKSLHSKIKSILGDEHNSIDLDLKKIEGMVFGKKIKIEIISKIFVEIRNGECKNLVSEGYSEYFVHLIKKLSDYDFNRLLLVRPDDELLISYHPTGVKRFFPMTNASAGEKSTALLSFILSGGIAPLIIDAPEDSLDNRVICEEIIPKIKRIKGKRQMIFATSNANVVMNSDAEMVISLAPKKKFINVNIQGAIDYSQMREEICNTLEGTTQAFERRASKYYAGKLYR